MTDPLNTIEEMLETWDWESARPTGIAVSRSRAHREGIPHEAVHLWIMRLTESGPDLLFQQRAPHKENYPDCLDITVGGHVPFGLAEGKVVKEASEEVGIVPDEHQLIDLGWYRYEEHVGSLFQREFQQVFLLVDNRPLAAYRFTDREVTGIFAVPLNRFEALLHGDFTFSIEGFDGAVMVRRTVARRDFHPQLFDSSMEGYMDTLCRALRQAAGGGPVTERLSLK